MPRFQPNRLRVVIVDDEELVRHAIRNILTVPDIDVIAEADDGESALELVIEMAPDVVVMDLGLPGVSGIEATRSLATVAPLAGSSS